MIEQYRASFERWAVSPPREWRTEKFRLGASWEGQYMEYHVQCAWEAWAHACESAQRVIDKERQS